MVLLGDIVGDDDDAVARGRLARWCASPTRAAAKASSPVSAEARKKFWLDRSRTAAIAQAHQRVQDQRGRGDPARRAWATTPTASSASTSSCRSRNKLQLADALRGVLRAATCRSAQQRRRRRAMPRPSCSRTASQARRSSEARAGCARRPTWRAQRWQRPGSAARRRRRRVPRAAGPHGARVVEDASCARRCRQIFAGARVRADRSTRCDAIHSEVLRGRVFVALHMHAGDGNVHTNIPVNSDDYEMLQDGATRRSRASWRWRARSTA